MAAGRQSAAWDHTCSIIAATFNSHRGKNSPIVKPNQFHPLKRQQSSGGLPFDGETMRAISEALKAREANG